MDSITHSMNGSIHSTYLIRKMASKHSILSLQKQCQSCTTLLTGEKQTFWPLTLINEIRASYRILWCWGKEGKRENMKRNLEDIKILRVVVVLKHNIFFPPTFQNFHNVGAYYLYKLKQSHKT